jgi:hypothetical protein
MAVRILLDESPEPPPLLDQLLAINDGRSQIRLRSEDGEPLSSNGVEAIRLARAEFPVLPLWWVEAGKCACGAFDCDSPGKHPIAELVPSGLYGATKDRSIIREWFKRYSKANIGVRTGAVSSTVVLDVDPRNGGAQALEMLEAEHGALPLTAVQETGGNGHHYVFKDPGCGLTGKLDHGIDIKGDNAYIVVAPRNHHTGGVYTWQEGQRLGEIELAELPKWVIKRARKDLRPKSRYPQTSPFVKKPHPTSCSSCSAIPSSGRPGSESGTISPTRRGRGTTWRLPRSLHSRGVRIRRSPICWWRITSITATY